MLDQLRPRPTVAEAEQTVRAIYSSPALVEGYTVRADEPLGEVETAIADRHLRAGDRLLDVGCGGGREAFGLARRGVRVVGVDASAPLVERAREAAQALPAGCDATFLIASAANLDFPPSSFDALWLASELYPEIPGRVARVALLRRYREFVRGPLIVFANVARTRRRVRWLVDVPRRLFGLGEPGDRILRDPLAGQARFYRHRFAHESEVRAEFADAGLRVVERIASAFVLIGNG